MKLAGLELKATHLLGAALTLGLLVAYVRATFTFDVEHAPYAGELRIGDRVTLRGSPNAYAVVVRVGFPLQPNTIAVLPTAGPFGEPLGLEEVVIATSTVIDVQSHTQGVSL